MNSAVPSLMSLPTRLGRFELLSLLGRGGMGAVYLAEMTGDGGFRRRVAVKVMGDALGDAAALGREARLGGLLEHPNLVRTLLFEEADGVHLLAMDYVEGPTLAHVISLARQRGEAPPLSATLEMGRQLCRGLGWAHQAQGPQGSPLRLIHRDLKPSNVLLSVHGEVKIADFGIAHALLGVHHSTTGVVRGTAAYMAPEQALGQAVSQQADLWALGAILFELVTLSPLVDPRGGLAGLIRIAQGDTAGRMALLSQAPVEIEALLRSLLSHDPQGRPADAAEAEALIVRCTLTRPVAPGALAALATDALAHLSIGGGQATATASARLSFVEAPAPRPMTAPWTDGEGAAAASLASKPAGAQALLSRRWPLWAAAFAALVLGGVVGLLGRGGKPQPLVVAVGAGAPTPEQSPVAVDDDDSLATPPSMDEPLRAAAALPPDRRAEAKVHSSASTTELAHPPQPPLSGASAAETAVETGFLTVNSEPFSWVYLGSERVGHTPLIKAELPAGLHTLTLKADGHRPRPMDVHIRPGELTVIRPVRFEAEGEGP